MGRGAVVAVSKGANARAPGRRAIAATERIDLGRTMSPRKYTAQVLNVLEAHRAAAQVANTISMLTPSGTWMRISCRNARSSASRSMSRLWIRISQRSHVSLPSPSGDFRTGTTSRFVGRGIGPAIATPVRSLISLICWHTLSTFFGSVPLSEMRAFWGMVQPRERKQKATASALLDVDDLTRRDGLSHVPDREAPHLRERLERLDDEGFRRSNLDAGRVAGLEEVGLLGLRRARDRVDVLHREAQREVRRLRRDRELIERLDKGGALVPRHLGRRLDDVLALVRADRDEGDLVDLVADAPQEPGEFRLQFVEPRLGEGRLRRVHLVDRDDQLLDTKRAGEEDVLLRLRLDALCGADDEDRGVRLGRARDHVLDEVPVARGVDDREVVLVRVKALVRDVDRKAARPLLLDLVHDEGELEGGLAHLLGELLQILQFVRVDVPGVVEDPADGRRLPVVDVADEHEVEVWLRGHGFYPVGRTLSSFHIYAYPTRAISSIGNERMEDGTDSLSAEAEAGRLDDVFMGPRDLRLARAAEVDERQFLPRRRMANVGGGELAAEQEFEIPVVRRTREPLRRVDLRDHRGTGEREVGQLELLPSNASGSIVGRFAKDQMGRRKHPAVRVRLDARWIEGTDMVPRGLWIHVAHEDLS